MSDSRYFNRELSWLEFNQRVLDEARDPSIPLLERLKFLAITASNLDEFFMVRVGGLQTLVRQGNESRDPAGMTPYQQLSAIRERVRQFVADQYACLLDELEPALGEAGVRRLRPADIGERQARHLDRVFEETIYPVFSPTVVDRNEEFPLLPGQTMNLALLIRSADERSDNVRLAIIPFGRSSQRIFTLPSDGGYHYILLEDVLKMYQERYFAESEVLDCVPFRLTRNAEMSVREDAAADLLVGMEEVLDARRESECVRLEIAADAKPETLEFLKTLLDVSDEEVYALPGPLDFSALMRITSLPGFDQLRYEPWPPQESPDVEGTRSMFDVLAEGDVLLHHPFESFEPVVRLLEEAADDPDVLAIKQTLYRTSRNSPIVAALRRAALRGKTVTAILELKARFDEARNIEWSKNLEQAEVQVIYGVRGLKTHAKVTIIVRREPQGIRRYLHFGTGNYNESTARQYTDISLMTSDEALAADATRFFNAVTGCSQPQAFQKIEAAPLGLRERILEMIGAEAERRRQGQEARLWAKMNSLVDPRIIDALYAASQAGVEIRLCVRGICCLRPGVPGLSENIEVVSIVDRFLEHSRIYYFHHGGDRLVFISSADWMPRNLDRRVELLVPVEDTRLRERLIHVLATNLSDTVKGRRLSADGSYRRTEPSITPRIRSQESLYREARDAIELRSTRHSMFEPHRAAGDEDRA